MLTRILAAAVQQRLTRSVVLSRPAVHIKGVWGFDMGWGCGYRNALMTLSALLLSQPAYRLVFSRNINGADPGVRRMQGWIEQAWGNGYDRVGRGQLKGKVLGTRKWIGTSDLYAMLSAKAIPCELYDFPKPKDAGDGPRSAHLALQQWVKKYFLEDGTPPSSHPAASLGQPTISAFDVMMGTGQGGAARGEAVRLSAKYPLILQHSGHSRTIIGYEEAANGTVNLLLLDPGRTMPRDVRSAGIDGLSHQRQQPFRPPLPGKISSSSSSRSFLHEPIPFSPPYTNGASEIIQLRHDEVGSNGTGPIFGLAEDEETDGGGWVRKRVDQVLQRKDTRQSYNPPWIGPVSKSLGYFRANLGSLR